jgi:hypothetical protein
MSVALHLANELRAERSQAGDDGFDASTANVRSRTSGVLAGAGRRYGTTAGRR